MKKFNSQKAMHQFFVEIIGSILIAAAIYNFALHAEFPMTGFSGISLILYRFLNIPIGMSTVIMNIPIIIICYKLLGKRFLISSFRCMLISSIIIDYIAPLFPVYEGERLLAALATGVIGGIGYAIIYMANSSTGGMDFITMSVKAINPHIPLGKIVFITDTTIVTLGGILFKGPPENGETEIGYGIDEAFRGKGYAPEAVTRAIRWAFENGANTVVAKINPGNHASRRVLEKVGMREYRKIGKMPCFRIDKSSLR